VDALYFSVVTLTTIGYGDVEPKKGASKFVVCFMALLGVPFFGTLLARIVEIAYGTARSDDIQTVKGGLTDNEFGHLVDFSEELWKAGIDFDKLKLGKPNTQSITPLEFLCFILRKNDSVSVDEITAILENFMELDKDGTGVITRGSRKDSTTSSAGADER